jgi:hypothetical protein
LYQILIDAFGYFALSLYSTASVSMIFLFSSE